MFEKHAKAIQTLRKALGDEAVDALVSILGSDLPLEPRSPMILKGIADQRTQQWLAKRSSQATDKPAFQLGAKALAKFDGFALGVGKWCKTVADWTAAKNLKNDDWEFTVQCRDADDEQGLRTTGTTFTVYLQITGGGQPQLNIGDRLLYFFAQDGLRIAFPSPSATAYSPLPAAKRPVAMAMPSPQKQASRAPYHDGPLVGFITPALYSGGAERWMLQLIRSTFDSIDWAGVACIRDEWNAPDVIREFEKLLPVYGFDHQAARRLFDCDCLVTWGMPELSDVAKEYQGALVFVSHGDGESEWTKKAIQGALGVASHFVAVSPQAALPYAGLVNLAQVDLLPNGIDQSRCESSLSHKAAKVLAGYSSRDFLIGCIGRVGAEKNDHVLVSAIELLPPRFKLVLVGDGIVKSNIQEIAEKRVPGRIKFLSATSAIGDLLRAFDCAVSASPSEGFGFSVVEALYAGVPLVGATIGILSQIERDSGVCWEPVPRYMSGRELADGILRIADNYPAALKRAAAGRQAVMRDYTLEKFGERWSDYLLRITRDGRR